MVRRRQRRRTLRRGHRACESHPLLAPDADSSCTRLCREEPPFAIEAGIAALRRLVEGYGYDVTGLDVSSAYSFTMKAAGNAGCAEETRTRIRELVSKETFGERFVTKVLGRQLELS